MLLKSQARHVQHMQKALTQMNVQLANVISDVAGETGQKILRAIVADERDGQVLGAMKNARIHASIDAIAKSLQGNWRTEHLFALKQALDAFDFIGTQLAECDLAVEQQLQNLQAHAGEPAKGKKRGRARNAPKFAMARRPRDAPAHHYLLLPRLIVTLGGSIATVCSCSRHRLPLDWQFATHRLWATSRDE
jgi:transposase